MGLPETLDFTCEIDENWVVDNMWAVVFVYDDTGVLQATRAKLIAEPEDGTQPGDGETTE